MARLIVFFVLSCFVVNLFSALEVSSFKSISVTQTNFMSEGKVTNGLTLGGIRKTAWPQSWEDYSFPDSEGGTIYGSYILNTITNETVNFAVNYLTNFWGQETVVMGIGFPPIDVPGLASENASIFAIGDGMFNDASLSASGTVYLFGGTNFRRGAATNAFSIYGFGEFSFEDGILNDNNFTMGIGKSSFNGSTVTNSDNLIGIGIEPFTSSTISDSQDMLALGTSGLSGTIQVSSRLYSQGYDALTEIILTNSTGIFGYGEAALQGAKLTNSSGVYGFGKQVGLSLAGTYTDIYLFGKSAQPTLTANQQVFGAGTDNYAFPGTGGLTVNNAVVTNNLGAILSVGDTTFVNVQKASQTNSVTGALTFAHATNGVHGTDFTHVRWIFVPSGGPHTLTVPALWRTNVYSPVPPALTNGTITRMILSCVGPTANAASQTNCYVSFDYFK